MVPYWNLPFQLFGPYLSVHENKTKVEAVWDPNDNVSFSVENLLTETSKLLAARTPNGFNLTFLGFHGLELTRVLLNFCPKILMKYSQQSKILTYTFLYTFLFSQRKSTNHLIIKECFWFKKESELEKSKRLNCCGPSYQFGRCGLIL